MTVTPVVPLNALGEVQLYDGVPLGFGAVAVPNVIVKVWDTNCDRLTLDKVFTDNPRVVLNARVFELL